VSAEPPTKFYLWTPKWAIYDFASQVTYTDRHPGPWKVSDGLGTVEFDPEWSDGTP
jgi:hypothetical protein